MRYCQLFKTGVVLVFVLVTWHRQAALGANQPPDLDSIADRLRQQDAAWDDLTVEYTCEVWGPSASGLVRNQTKKMRWLITQKGWEKLIRTTPANRNAGEESDWEEVASSNGLYYMTRDNQLEGNGTIGRWMGNFLNNHYSVKRFGLFVSGLELRQPFTTPDFFSCSQAGVKVTESRGDVVTVAGKDPSADGQTLVLWLDAKVGYRPNRIESRDEGGLIYRIDGLKYRRLQGVRGEFWFPEEGVWHGTKSAEDRSLGSQTQYHLTSVHVDRHPQRSEFVLTYPEGALLTNNDTGVACYVTKQTTAEDVPAFQGKLMTIAEHDAIRLREQAAAKPRQQVRARWFVGVNIAFFALIVGWLWLRQRRRSREAVAR